MDFKIKNKESAAQTKEKNIPFYLDSKAVLSLIERIAGKKYAQKFVFEKIEAKVTGMDCYRISDFENNKILVEATSGVAAATAFKWYLENRCNSYVGPVTRRLNFPDTPPDIKTVHENESVCLYRYFLNFCTYGYTLAFWQWDKWQSLLDWMMLAGYNLVLNPLAHEMVWLKLLQKNGYTQTQAENFISAPIFFPWQCMMNITTWGGAAPLHWYEERVELSRKVNSYLQSFGAGVMLPGYSGMVPADFKEHFGDSNPINQGLWCDMPRPSILLPDDKYFGIIAKDFYNTQKEIFGDKFNYFSTDPFHEGGDSSLVDLNSYAKSCLSYMKTASENPVWFLQGWQNNPLREMLRALSPSDVLIGNLRSTDHFDGGDNFADYPWLYCCVNNFGGQRVMRGNMNKMLNEAFNVITDNNYTAVGLGIIPEGIENDEILFDVFAAYAVQNSALEPDEWLKRQIVIRYGSCPENTFKAWKLLRDCIYVGDTEKIPLESSLLTRPSLTVDMVSTYASNEFTYNPETLNEIFRLMMKDYELIQNSEPYSLDIIDIARQVIANKGWKYLKGIQQSFKDKNEDSFEKNVSKFMSLYDVQEKIVSCNRNTMLGNWIETARENGKTNAEKAYFEYLAKTILTTWGDKNGEIGLHDYAAKEWSGMIEDFYRPRWNSYINILRRSFVTGEEPMDFSRYDSEYFFNTISKAYPTEPFGNIKSALNAVLAEIK